MLFRLLQGTGFLTFKLHSLLLNYIPLVWYGSSQATKMPLSKAYCSRGMWSCRTLHFLHCSDACCRLYSKPANAALRASKRQTRSLNFLIMFTCFPSLFTELSQMKSSCRAFDTRAGTECRFLNGIIWSGDCILTFFPQCWEICSRCVSSFPAWECENAGLENLRRQRLPNFVTTWGSIMQCGGGFRILAITDWKWGFLVTMVMITQVSKPQWDHEHFPCNFASLLWCQGWLCNKIFYPITVCVWPGIIL